MDRLTVRNPGATERLHSGTPIGRMGAVADIANTTVFLFSAAAAYITGQVIVVDGGTEHMRSNEMPYPQALLDPDSVKHLIKPRL